MLTKALYAAACGALAEIDSQKRKYAIYGTGRIGKLLLRMIKSSRMKEPDCFIDDNACPGTQLEGIPALGPSAAAARGLEVVVLGTDCFQTAMRESMRAHFKGLLPLTVDLCAGGSPAFPSYESLLAPPGSEASSKRDDYELGWLLDSSYQARQAALLSRIKAALASGMDIDKALSGFEGTAFGERVVEYPFAFKWLWRHGPGAKLLDIGCVLNNEIVADELGKCEEAWFCNPAPEPNRTGVPAFYHLADVRNARLKDSSFDIISCLSTIEHMGFDNSQYGSSSAPLYSSPDDRPMLQTLEAILRWLKPGGHFLLSVPFGKRMACRHRGTKRIAFQLFDCKAMLSYADCVSKLGGAMSFKAYAAAKDGWRLLPRPEDCELPYAHGVPCAGAVAIMEGRKS